MLLPQASKPDDRTTGVASSPSARVNSSALTWHCPMREARVVAHLAVGDALGGYQLESVLGQGGMGKVFRAHDARLDRKVAVKVIEPELATDEEFRERFLREARVAALLDHPHIVPVYE